LYRHFLYLGSLIAEAYRELIGKLPPVERIVCLGLGSLVDGEASGKRISKVQLALLLELNKLVNVHPFWMG
jgi:SRR1